MKKIISNHEEIPDLSYSVLMRKMAIVSSEPKEK